MATVRRIPKFENATVTPVVDRYYDGIATRLIASVAQRCFCSMFIVNITPRGGDYLVDDLLKKLRDAYRRGVDVRVVVSGSNDTLAILESSAIAVRRLRQLDVPVRWAAESLRSTHAKTLICDDEVLLGPHNWSADAFGGSTQDSVLVASKDFSAALAGC